MQTSVGYRQDQTFWNRFLLGKTQRHGFETACKEFFDRILFGDPTEEVERLVQSSQTGDYQ